MQNPKFPSFLKWVSEIPMKSQLLSSKAPISVTGISYVAQNLRFYVTQRTAQPEEVEISIQKSSDKAENGIRIKPSVRKRAEVAMFDYFYCTRGLQLMDAENMSKNAPTFLESLLKKINVDMDIGHSISRYLRFHPVNEFEPFLESSGLKQAEYCHLLPHNKLFLNEDASLLDNHHVLCNYGIAHTKIGKIYKEATEVFRYSSGVMASKIQAYEDLGFSKLFLSKLIICSPNILIGNTNADLVKVLEILKAIGLDLSWVQENLSEEESYTWSTVHQALSLLGGIGFHKDELSRLIRRHPGLIFENSGEWTVMLVGFQLKFGTSAGEIRSLFLQFPHIQVGKFVLNLRQCFLFLNEIEMNGDEIGKIIRSHSSWLGSCNLKKTSSLLGNLRSGKKRLCHIIQENPQEMKKWTLGSRIQPLPDSGENVKSRMMKKRFLLDLGYAENSKDMERGMKNFRGKGSELQERYNVLVNTGLKEKHVREMIEASPQILNQTKDVLEAKVDYLVNELGYPLLTLVAFPSLLKFTLQRVKLRFAMYSWLRDKGKVDWDLALSTMVACSDKYFVTYYVNRHPDGLEYWEDLKKQILSD